MFYRDCLNVSDSCAARAQYRAQLKAQLRAPHLHQALSMLLREQTVAVDLSSVEQHAIQMEDTEVVAQAKDGAAPHRTTAWSVKAVYGVARTLPEQSPAVRQVSRLSAATPPPPTTSIRQLQRPHVSSSQRPATLITRPETRHGMQRLALTS